MIRIISSQKTAALERSFGGKAAWARISQISQISGISGISEIAQEMKTETGSQLYLDISGLTPAELKRAIGLLKKKCAASFWGIIDPKGEAGDPAVFFFEGACDYIGPSLVKKGLDKKRFAAAYSFWLPAASTAAGAEGKAEEKQKRKKLPAGKFGGWKSLRTGTTAPFFFMFVSVTARSKLRSNMGEEAFSSVKKRLRDVLQQYLSEANALLWMETEDNCLFLIPPRADNGRAALEAGFRMLLNGRIIGIEKLGLSIPLDFTFALHYGKTVFRAPGKTGAIISDSINYIFHLGTKRAEPGRFTVSADVSDEAIPKGLLELFIPAGVFEGIPFRHSRRFS